MAKPKAKSAVKLRKCGDVLLDLELLLYELVDHGLQTGDILALIHVWITVHAPSATEEYEVGGSPTFYYGPAKPSSILK